MLLFPCCVYILYVYSGGINENKMLPSTSQRELMYLLYIRQHAWIFFFHASSLIHKKQSFSVVTGYMFLILHVAFYNCFFMYIASTHKAGFGRKWCYQKVTCSSIHKCQCFIYSVMNSLKISWKCFKMLALKSVITCKI